jgi:hypothetical protein
MDMNGGLASLFGFLLFIFLVRVAGAGEAMPSVPAALAVPARHELKVRFGASGVQIYKCQPSMPGGSDFVWTFSAPEAILHDAAGRTAGRHYAGPSWEADDGSKVAGKLAAKVPAPDGVSIPWLLLNATVAQPGATFDRVDFVQRVNTSGGAAPASGCTSASPGVEVRVPYTADYYFYSSR